MVRDIADRVPPGLVDHGGGDASGQDVNLVIQTPGGVADVPLHKLRKHDVSGVMSVEIENQPAGFDTCKRATLSVGTRGEDRNFKEVGFHFASRSGISTLPPALR